jgi:hypothetical protein
VSEGSEQRVSGICVRCQTHTADGIYRSVESGSGWGPGFIVCADFKACAKREGPARPRMHN